MNQFMEEALKEADTGIENGHGGPFGAVVVRNQEIIGRGHNCVLLNHDPTAHGEIMAIRDACQRLGTFSLNGCVLYTTAEPCPMCLGAILWSGIEQVFFGCDRLDTEAIHFRDNAFYQAIEGGLNRMMTQIDQPECRALFAKYESLQNKTMY